MTDTGRPHNPYDDADAIRTSTGWRRRASSKTHRGPSSPHSPSEPAGAPRHAGISHSPHPAAHARGTVGHAQPAHGAPTGSTPLRGRPDQAQHAKSRPYRTRRKTNFGILVALILAAIAVLSGILWWINRPVRVTVDGTETQARIGSSLEEVFREQRVSVEPGDYVSVAGNVLGAGAGDAFTATVNGQELTSAEQDAYHVAGDEVIEFGDGRDVTEQYSAESEEVLPYLRFEGTGYSLQYVSQWGRSGTDETRHGKESNETATVRVKEPVDCVITRADPLVEGDEKLVALTFDDGPVSPYTESYLEICAQYGVKATFFNLGVNVQQVPELSKRIVEEGHFLANHTMDHNQLTEDDPDTIREQIERSADVIEDTVGIRPTMLRPPYGDFTEQSWLASRGSVTSAVCWTADSRDWSLPGAAAIVDMCLMDLHSGSIILMHDGGGDRSQDVEALPTLIERLQGQGYRFVTVPELLSAVGAPEDVCTGSAAMPEDAVWPEEIAPDDIADDTAGDPAGDLAEQALSSGL